MKRYVITRTLPEPVAIPTDADGAKALLGLVDQNLQEQVTWVHSYVSDDRTSTFCVYDAPSEEALRRAADRTGLPIDDITEVRVLDPYFYTPAPG